MDIVMRTGFQPVSHAINFDAQKIEKGKALAALHVRRVEELSATGNNRLLRCSVVRTTSVTEHPYKVQLDLNGQRCVTHASCTCVSGVAHKCKHIYSLIYYVNTHRGESKTSFEQEWGKPTDAQLGKDIYAQPLVIQNVFKTKSVKEASTMPYPVSYSDVLEMNCPLRQVLQVESLNKEKLFICSIIKELIEIVISKSIISDIEACAFSLVNSSTSNIINLPMVNIVDDVLNKFYESKIKLTEEEIIQICGETVNQSECQSWFNVRNVRISASSKAHFIKQRIKKSCDQLANDFLNVEKKQNISSFDYGIKHEKEAVNEYISLHESVVKQVGVFVMPQQPWLCVSADGIIFQNDCILKVLEIKCPFSCKTKPVFDSANQKFNVGYLQYCNGDAYLNPSHQYYTQCQVLMYVTGLTECDLYVWSPKGSYLVNIHEDEHFLRQLIPKLQQFYFGYFLPLLYVNNQNNQKSQSDEMKQNNQNNESNVNNNIDQENNQNRAN